jgi:GAF domain-containing protein
MFFLPHHIALFFIFEAMMVFIAVIVINLLMKTHILDQQTKRIRSTENIIKNLRKNFNIKEIKDFTTQGLGKELKADRCFLAEYDPKTQKFSRIDWEYLSSHEIKSLKKRLPPIGVTRLTNVCINDQMQVIPNADKYIKENNLYNSAIDLFYQSYSVKSSYLIPLRYSATMVGVLAIHFCHRPVTLTREELEFINNLAESIAVAINQAELYEKQEQALKREKLLSKLITTIRSSLDSSQIQEKIVNQIGQTMHANRCVLSRIDKTSKKFTVVAEYRETPDVKSFFDVDVNQDLPALVEKMLNREDIIVDNARQYLAENDYLGSSVENHFTDFNIESGFAIPITYYDDLLGMLVIHYDKEDADFGEEEINFVKTIANQIGISLYQANLYENQKKIAQKEKVLRSFVTAIRESLDIEQIKHKIVMELGKLFSPERVFILDYDSSLKKYLPLTATSEYRRDESLMSITELDMNIFHNSPFFRTVREMNLDLIHPDFQDYMKKRKDIGEESLKRIKELGIESSIVLNILYAGEFLGHLVIHYCASKRPFSEEELDYIRTIADQIGIAIYQSRLFKNIQQQAQKESILRQIISKIKFTKSLEEAYNKLLEEISEIYDLKRVLFLESSPQNTDELIIKYEHIDKKNNGCGNNLAFPQVCIDDFLNLINNFNTLVINNVLDCYPDEQSLKFFEKYHINSLMAVPLVKYNGEAKVFGFIILCGETPREWSTYEIKLLESISESVISVLWEITKFVEVEDLRNSFVLTLAHDFQVPLIGERNALEYIIQYNKDKIGADAELLEEILENNKNIITLLDKSVDIYSYEAGKKVIAQTEVDIKTILKEAIANITLPDKKVTINFEEPQNSILVKVDKIEIEKVFHTILENAMEKSPENSTITIGVQPLEKKVKIFFKDQGPGISEEMQEKIFNRYEMALAIERKIGAGTGLFLAKRIIEAHKGSIYFETAPKRGTTFFIILPTLEPPEKLKGGD